MTQTAPVSTILRPVTGEDESFLLELYASTRKVEVAAWGWSQQQQDWFLQMQFRSQQLSYHAQFPNSEHSIIALNSASERSLGRLWVARTREELRLVDITLLPEYRDRQIGSRLIQVLINEATQAQIPLRLHVLPSNPALRLYERLGGIRTAQTETHYLIEWR